MIYEKNIHSLLNFYMMKYKILAKKNKFFYENNFFYLNKMSKILAKMRKLRRSNHTHDLTAYWLTNECRNRSIALIYIGLDSLDV